MTENTSIIKCPPLDDAIPLYIIADKIFSSVGLVPNIISIYCIVFCSTINMTRYKWYLLYNQVLTASCDLIFSTCSQVYVYFPFAVFNPLGLAAKYKLATSHIIFVTAECMMMFSIAAAVHLFHYRYLVAKGQDHFPLTHRVLSSLIYATSFIPGVFLGSIGGDTRVVLEVLAKEYTCVTSEMINTPTILAYDPFKFIYIFLPIMMTELLLLGSLIPIFVYKTLSAIMISTMSAKTRRMQKYFLFTLMAQVLAPMAVMIIPCSVVILIAYYRVFGLTVLGNVCFAVMSIHGSVGGTVLILVQPTYRRVFVKTRASISRPAITE